MKMFFGIAAVLAWLFGTALLLFPAKFYAPIGIAMPPLVATLAQAHGATLIGLAFIDWLSRRADHRGQFAVLVGNCVSQILSLGIVIHTMRLGVGRAVAPGVVIHVVLITLFLVFAVRVRRLITVAA